MASPMRATTTLLENNRIMLTVEIDDVEMDEAMDTAAKTLSKQVSVKGFRKGKVPKNVLIANIGGTSVLRSEAIRESLPDFYARAVADSLIDPIGQPDINLTAVERPIVTGDLVTMDVHVQQTDTDAEALDMTDFMYTVGTGSIAEGIDELIIGLNAGEDLKMNAPVGEGVVATYELKLKQVQERVLPELTDEWVSENSEWTSAEEMREAILVQMRRRKIVEAQMSQRDAALIALSELVAEEAAPEVLINAETNERLHDLGERLGAQKLTLEMFLQVTNQTPEDLLATLRQDAVRAVRVDLAMRALVAAEHLDASPEEIDEELERTAEAMGTTADVLRDNLRDSGRAVSFTAEVSKMKASKWLSENVVYVDPEGVEIDSAMLRADQSVDDAENDSESLESDDGTAEETAADA